MQICSQCGTTNSESDKYCKKCGQPLSFKMSHIATISRKRIKKKSQGSQKPNSNTKKPQSPNQSKSGSQPQSYQQQDSQPSTSNQKIQFRENDQNNLSMQQQNLNPIPIPQMQGNQPNPQQQRNYYSPPSNNQKNFPLKPIPASNDQNFVIPSPLHKKNPMIPRNNFNNPNAVQNNSQSYDNNQSIPQYSQQNQRTQRLQQIQRPNSYENALEQPVPKGTPSNSIPSPLYAQEELSGKTDNLTTFNPNSISQEEPVHMYQKQNSLKTQRTAVEHQYQHQRQRSPTKPLDQDKFQMAMAEAVQSLKRNLGPMVKKSTTIKKNLSKEEAEIRKELVPESLNEILVSLSDIDLNIEASALVNIDGTILASATSKRITESLISTIGTTLGNISQDIISSLGSGDLQFASLQGSQGILFMAPVMKNVFLVLLTSIESKSGVINIAKVRVKKQLELFYAKKNLQKLPI